jgi:hypothetical protein
MFLTAEDAKFGENWNWAKASQRNLAWRTMLVSAINAGLKLNKFKLDVAEGAPREPDISYNLTIAGYPSIVEVHDIGYEELTFYVGVNILKPDPKIASFSGVNRNEYRGVEAWAQGDLERRRGKWLQVLSPRIHCSKRLLPILAAVKIKPIGYKDHGRMFF